MLKKVGFDGIEIMASHGFFIDQFFWKKTNSRSDEYGAIYSIVPDLLVRLSQLVEGVLGQTSPLRYGSPSGNMMTIQQN